MAETELDERTTVETDDTTPESSTEKNAESAEDAEQDAKPSGEQEEGKDRESAKPEDSEDKTPKPDKDGRISVRLEQFERLKRQKSEMSTELDSLRELGIESKEHAEALRRDADNFHYVLEQLGSSPESFFADLQKSFPKAAETHDSNVIQSFLSLASDAYRRQGDTEGLNTAEVLDAVLKTIKGQPRSRSSEADSGQRSELADDKWEVFSDYVRSERDRALATMIEELAPKDLEFRSQKQREKFISDVSADVLESLAKDTVFRRELDYAENPRRGLGRQQREEALKAYRKYLSLNDSKRIRASIAEQASLMNLTGTANGKDGKPKVRREASASGAPSTGPATAEEKARIRTDLEKKGLTGTKLMETYLAEIRKRTLRA